MELTGTVDTTMKEVLSKEIKGEVIFPEDKNYEETRKVYNAMINKHPGIIIKCIDTADVIKAVNFGRENNLLIAVRGGGHNGGGLGLCDGGMVIDLSEIKFVRVNAEDKTVRVGAGNLWGEVDHATHPFGLAIPSGMISTTGVAGLTLGGGVGYLARKYGLTIDSLLEVDMVMADGNYLTVNNHQYPDLFWAVRGGGGNFGIVTSFKFQAHPVKMVYGGPTLWPIEQAEEVMEWYDKFIEDADEDINGFIATMIIPGPPFPDFLHNKQFCGIVWCYLGDPKNADKVFEPIKKMKPIFEHLGEMPYPAIQTMFDGLMPPGLQWYWRADFFNDLGPELRKQHKKFGSQIPTPLSQMHLYPINGAASRPKNSDTAWAYRDAKYAGVIVGVDPDPANSVKITKWCKEYWEALHPHSAGGAYSNFLMNEGEERVKASYKGNYEKLVEVKRKYDPNNLFRVNQNIKP